MRTPEATIGGRSSNGTVFRFTVSRQSWRRSCAARPVHSVARRSSWTRWVSVPPVSTSKPPSIRPAASVSAFARTCRWYVAERVGRRDPEADRLGRDRVHQRPALHAGEERAVERLRVLLGAEHEAGARAGERLVRRRGDEVRVRHRARVQPGRDEAGEMGHVGHQHRPHLVGDLAEPVGLDRPRIGRAAADDQLRPHLLRLREHLVVVDGHRLARDAVVVELVELPGEVDLQAVRQVAAVVEREPEHAVARLRAPRSRRPCSPARPRAAGRSRARRRTATLARSRASSSISSTTSQPP